MSQSRVPEIPLPRPFLRVTSVDTTTRDDLENLRKGMQQRIDALENELKSERELAKKLEKSAHVLQDILSAPDFRALSHKTVQAVAVESAEILSGNRVDEPPVEYVDVTEIELTDRAVKEEENKAPTQKGD